MVYFLKFMLSFNRWEIQACILLSLFLQFFLNVAGTLRRLASRRWIVKILWSAYLLAEFVAVFGLGLIVSKQSLLHNYAKDPGCKVFCDEDDYKEDQYILMYWATFLLVHLGGPDTITAFAMEDNELWLRHLFYLASKCIAVAYAVYESVMTTDERWIPVIIMFLYGIIKCTERTCALYCGSAKRFRNSILSKNDLEVNNIPENECKVLIKMNGTALSHVEMLQYAFEFFETFKGLVVDLSLSIRQRNQSREFFLAISSKDAFRLVEVELNYLYDVLFTKIPVLHHKVGFFCRTLSFIAVVSSLVLFFSAITGGKKTDVVVTYILIFGAIMLEVIAAYMLLFCDWTVVKLKPSLDTNPNHQSWTFFIGHILFVNNIRSILYQSCLFLFENRGAQNEYKFTDSRWANSFSSFNLIFYCLHRRSNGWEKFYTYLGLLRFLNGFLYVKPLPLTQVIAPFIFDELKIKSKEAGTIEVAKQICSSKGEWLLKELHEDTFLHYVTKYNYDEILLLWHIATELCYNDMQEQEINMDQRDTAKKLSDYMLYLMVMKADMMSGVSSTGETKFRDTCTEVSKFFDTKLPELKKRKFCNFYRRESQEEKESLQRKACETILSPNTEVELVTVHGERKIFFTASVLAKKLKNIPAERKWLMISKLWVELLSYAATHVRSTAHAKQLTEGGELVTIVWLLMAHFGLGDQYEIDTEA